MRGEIELNVMPGLYDKIIFEDHFQGLCLEKRLEQIIYQFIGRAYLILSGPVAVIRIEAAEHWPVPGDH